MYCNYYHLIFQIFPEETESDVLFRDKSKRIFIPGSYWSNNTSLQNGYRTKYDSYYLIDFCDNTKELLSSFFDHFIIEGIPKSYKAFLASATSRQKANYFGISPFFYDDSNKFVLVRVFKRTKKYSMEGW